MKKLNILQINSSKTWAGGETHIRDLSRGLISNGHNVILLLRKEISRHFRELDAEIYELPLKNAIDLYSIYKIVKIIKEENIDIIHVHNGKDYWMGVFAKKFVSKVKVIATRHILKPLGNSFLHKKLFSNIDQFVAVSESVKSKLIKQNKIDKKNIIVIHNGMRMKNLNNIKTNYLYDELKIAKDVFKIGIVGTLCKRKNQEVLIKTASAINNSNLKFIIVGSDPSKDKKYKKKLERIIIENNVKDKVIMTGFREDNNNLMSFFDLLVVPSKSEAFGLVVIEAMSKGTPVIAAEVNGIKEIIDNGVNGFLVNPNSVDDIKDKILDLYNNKSKYIKFSKNGIIKVENEFSLNVMSSKIEEVYYDNLRS